MPRAAKAEKATKEKKSMTTESVSAAEAAEAAKKIMIVEDERRIARFLQMELEHEGFETETEENGRRAYERIVQEQYDLVLLDIMLPDMDGLEVCRRVREISDVPIIMLTAKDDVEDKVNGLDIGADDYITKPFSMEELVKRVEAILRRVRGKRTRESTKYKIGRYTFDTQKQLLTIGEKQTKLTTKENELLALLCSHANEILKRHDALRTIWIDDNYFNARSMDVYITKLRKHLKDDDQVEIINIHGQGYKLIVPEEE